jgi:hypothetical protein
METTSDLFKQVESGMTNGPYFAGLVLYSFYTHPKGRPFSMPSN